MFSRIIIAVVCLLIGEQAGELRTYLRLKKALPKLVDDIVEETMKDFPARKLATEIGYMDSLDKVLKGEWREHAMGGACQYGCKIYRHVETGHEVLAHNSAYGCYKEVPA